MGEGGQGGCELRSEAFAKIQKKIFFLWGGWGRVRRGGGGQVGGCQGGWEQRIKAFVKIQKKKLRGASRWGVRVDVNGEVKFCENSKQKK